MHPHPAPAPVSPARYYICPSSMPGRYDLRQTRFRFARLAGEEHPHDLMATCFPLEELQACIARHFAGSVEPFTAPSHE